MTKPFSLQSPEQIAKDYAGNKQQIAQAMQLGVVDPTAGVLAGMFIDRMRNAQMQEQAPQSTVAQQVMGGAPPGAPSAPPQAGGPGGLPPTAPPMTPEMGMSPEMGMAPPGPEQMPMGMADGGLATLPVPDVMFDAPSTGSYASGGLVAFSRGGEIDRERLRRALLMQESGGDYGATNREGSGAMGAYQFMPDTARGLAKRLGMEYRPELLAGAKARTEEGKAYQDKLMSAQLDDIMDFSGGDLGRAAAFHFAGPNEKGWKSKTRKYQEDIMRRYSGAKDDGKLPKRDVQDPEGRRQMREDMLGFAQDRFGALPEGGLAELEEFYRKELDPETRREQRRHDMWATLAQIGAGMAASDSPFFLQAVGQAIGAALPGASASRKERLEAERDARKGLREVLGLKRAEQKEVLQYAQDYELAEMRAEEGQIERTERRALAEQEQQWRSSEAALDRELQKEIEQARTDRARVTDLQTMINIQQNGTPEEKAALVEALKARQEFNPGAADMRQFLGMQGGGAGGAGGAGGVSFSQLPQ
jgi:hypothetical protein